MNSKVKMFRNPEFGKIRVILRGDVPWFVAKDVCEILRIANVTNAIEALMEPDECTIIGSDDSCIRMYRLSAESRIISESGLYSLLSCSRTQEVVRFQQWITSEVLPVLRTTGSCRNAPLSYVGSVEDIVGALTKLFAIRYDDKNQLMRAVNEGVKNAIGLDLLALSGMEREADTPVPTQDYLMTPTQLGEQMTPRWSAQRVNILLAHKEFQKNENNRWIPTEKGYAAGAVFAEIGKRYRSGTVFVRQLKWPRSILEELEM